MKKQIPLFKVFMSKKVDKPLLRVLHSGYIGQGNVVKDFEKLLAKNFNNNLNVTLATGTHGLHLALRLANIGPNDDVICTPLTCTATNWPVLYQGANIVWADINKDDLNISVDSIRERITNKTKAIIVMHWGGYPCDMEEIYSLAVENNLIVIEDAAHAQWSSYKDSITGSCEYSNFCMFSFQAIKNMTSVDGGVLFMKNDNDYKRAKLLRWYGIDRESPRQDMRCEEDILEWGYKYHMNDINATIGINNFEDSKKNITYVAEIVKYYRNELKDFNGITLLQNDKERKSSNWLFTIYVEDRIGFARHMGEKGIMVSRVHERNDKHKCVVDFVRSDLYNVDYAVNNMICIPCGWWVTKEDREYIISSIKEGW